MSLTRDDYPEHEKLHEVSELSQAIGEFLDQAASARARGILIEDQVRGAGHPDSDMQ